MDRKTYEIHLILRSPDEKVFEEFFMKVAELAYEFDPMAAVGGGEKQPHSADAPK